MGNDEVKKYLATVKGELLGSRVEYANLRSDRNEMLSRTQELEGGENKALKAVSSSLATVCAQMYSAVKRELENIF